MSLSLVSLVGSMLLAEPPTWVFFADKGSAEVEVAAALERRRAELSPRALARRVRARGDDGVDVRDLAPAPEYVAAVLATGAQIRATSRWLNAISVSADAQQRRAIVGLTFVDGVRPVARGQRLAGPTLTDEAPRVLPAYGAAQLQLDLLKVPALHECGLDGAGVVIGVQDSGFSLTHQTFATTQVLAVRDFVAGDDNVGPEPGDHPDQADHGTMVLSLIAGQDAAYSGVAPAATFVLAKTEVISEEKPYEEDLYVEGLEWIEGMGADLFTASLGYIDWYVPGDLDGKTAVTSQAAAVAIGNGLVMLTAMGNSGPGPGSLIAPADVDGILSIGATDLDGAIAGFSSRGPTADGRIKPDFVAPGKDVWVAHPKALEGYVSGKGTSFAAPLAAGVVALLKQAYPQLGPAELRELLRATAVPYGEPNNDAGWGMLDGLAAAGLYCTCVDEDEDGHFAAACGGDDCDDGAPQTHPGAREVCDGHDNDCDAATPVDEVDADLDGVLLCAGDCDDEDPGRWPGAIEDPDDCVDNDCDGEGDAACEPTTGGAESTGEAAGTTSSGSTSSGTTSEASSGEPPAPASGGPQGEFGDEAGCGCSSRGGGGWGLALGLAGLWRRRRVRRA